MTELKRISENKYKKYKDDMFWFCAIKELNIESPNGSITSEKETFRLPNGTTRNEAKKYLVEKYGDLPFAKPKKGKLGDKYFYLTPSNFYWWDNENCECEFTCEFCGNKVKVIGKHFPYRYGHNAFCSLKCEMDFIEKSKREYETIENENYFVSDCDHPMIDTQKELVGYIYKITNKVSMQFYVGQTRKPPLFRWWQHLKVDKKFEQENLEQLIFEVLEIVYFGDDEWDSIKYAKKTDKLFDREKYYINLFDSIDNGFNKII